MAADPPPHFPSPYSAVQVKASVPASRRRVVAAVIERGNLVLVAQRPAKKRHGGLWEFPGGKVEGEETDLDALRRELTEELGLRLTSAAPPVIAIKDAGSSFTIVFVPVVADGEPQCREHAALLWVAWPELSSLPLAPADRRFVEGRDSIPV